MVWNCPWYLKMHQLSHQTLNPLRCSNIYTKAIKKWNPTLEFLFFNVDYFCDGDSIPTCSKYMKIPNITPTIYCLPTRMKLCFQPQWNLSDSSPSRLARHADPPPGSRPNTDTHHISWPVRLNRIPCCSKENTVFRCTEGGIRVRKERGSYLVFTLQWQQAKWLFLSRHCPTLKSDPGHWRRLVLKRPGHFQARWIKEQCLICCSLISPIYHCLLRCAREPPGCKLQYQHWSASHWNQTSVYKSACSHRRRSRRYSPRWKHTRLLKPWLQIINILL